ncbi:MAG: ribonuclease HII [Patescibacteria group bacterium]
MAVSRKWVIGIDEAGRGPLAGPVTLAVVACPRIVARNIFKGINDSKHLSLKAREGWLKKIRSHPRIFYCASSAGPSIIDRVGIAKAIKQAVARVLKRIDDGRFGKTEILLDGSLKAPAKYLQKTIIRGDEKIPVIAAASVVAKVSRDRKMVRLSSKFPQYAFEIHKGYGTKLHYKMLKKHGLSEIHRRSFLSKIL